MFRGLHSRLQHLADSAVADLKTKQTLHMLSMKVDEEQMTKQEEDEIMKVIR